MLRSNPRCLSPLSILLLLICPYAKASIQEVDFGRTVYMTAICYVSTAESAHAHKRALKIKARYEVVRKSFGHNFLRLHEELGCIYAGVRIWIFTKKNCGSISM